MLLLPFITNILNAYVDFYGKIGWYYLVSLWFRMQRYEMFLIVREEPPVFF